MSGSDNCRPPRVPPDATFEFPWLAFDSRTMRIRELQDHITYMQTISTLQVETIRRLQAEIKALRETRGPKQFIIERAPAPPR